MTMAWTLNREELAWAAGFFDGEGSTYADPRPRLEVAQNHPEVLERFGRAIAELGTLGGGEKIYGRAKKPMYQYRVTGWPKVQAVVAMLWPLLSTQKRLQAQRVLLTDRDRRGLLGRNPRRLAVYTAENPRCGVSHPGLRVRDCTPCRAAQGREWRELLADQGGQ